MRQIFNLFLEITRIQARKMVFKCFKCFHKFLSVNDTLIHLTIHHGLQDSPYLRLSCCYIGCSSGPFRRLIDLKVHMNKHIDQLISANSLTETSLPVFEAPTNDRNPYLYDFGDKSVSEIIAKLAPEEQFALSLDGTSMPKSTIQFILDKTKILMNKVLQDISDFINQNNSPSLGSINNYVQSKKTILSSVDSCYKIEKIYDTFPDFVKIKPVYLCTKEKQVWDKKYKIFKTVPIACNFSYVPIIETLGFVLSTPGIRVINLFEKIKELDNGIYESIFDGSVFKNVKSIMRNNNVILMSLYYDETELVNPLGSKVKKHKIGAFYFTIFNLPDFLNSTLVHNHLVALFKVVDVLDDASLNKIIEPIIRDVKKLENDGIKVNGSIYNVTIGSVTGDNLGANELFQMVKCFRAEHYCNVCEIDSKSAKSTTAEDKSLLRNPEKYEKIIRDGIPPNKVHRLGIKGYCILNDLKYFHTCTNFTADIMHDILEGTLPLTIKLFLNHLIKLKVTTLEDINTRIFQFNYGALEIKNKPSPVSLGKLGNLIGERAAQNWCLARFLPLILSDFIRSDKVKQHWKVVTCLLEIIDIVFSPRIEKNDLAVLEKLTKEYCSQKISLYGTDLIPKDHFIQHYATIIEKMGPLYFMWCMRYEGKHNYFKDLMKKYLNFISVVETLARQHQKYIYNRWRLQDNNIFELPLTYSSSNTTKLSSLLDDYNLLSEEPDDTSIILCTNLKYAQKYYKSFFIVDSVISGVPIFYRIENTYIKQKVPFAVCKKYKTEAFDDVLHAYPIKEVWPEQFKVINLSTLQHIHSYEQHQPHDSTDYFIVLRYKF